ncbi:hypothetical protein SAMN04515618_101155 [Collimonas sp. OK307]|uniref:hypothetical protein n=1 Tax=Collimonas sp. OK307 TaxID=1801620 RepID=UPI0008EE340B|nr:hypothetical protein [Collimonas sp. OK307]SFH61996.1 hypothetical protein SAMN04515618_101155 [Collimonas sp. OK307]
MKQLVRHDQVVNASKPVEISILIADDHFILREDLTAIIAPPDDIAGAARYVFPEQQGAHG